MSENKVFHFAILVSILAHSVFFLALPRVPFVPGKRSPAKIKVTYYKIKETPKKKRLLRKRAEPIVRKLPRIKKEEILKPRPAAKKTKKAQEIKRASAIRKVKKKKRFETVVKEERDSRKKATYISYYRAVREKIRQEADKDYSRKRRIGKGEVFLSFAVTSSGELLEVKVIDEKSVAYASLRNIAINSIRDASPFPPFPKGMSQYRITFTVIISFELDK